MKLIKDTSQHGYTTLVPCIGANHDVMSTEQMHPRRSRVFKLVEGYAVIADDKTLVPSAYYCNDCAPCYVCHAPRARHRNFDMMGQPLIHAWRADVEGRLPQ